MKLPFPLVNGIFRLEIGHISRIVLLSFFPLFLSAQSDSLSNVFSTQPTQNLDALEDVLQNADASGDFDFNTLFESLEYYAAHPLDLNRATETELRELNLLSDVQIVDILQHRQRLGNFIALEELQSIPSLDLDLIRTLLPYLTIKTALDDYQIPLGQLLAQGQNELYLRWSRTLQEQKGFRTQEGNNRFLGDPNQLYVRYKHSYQNRLSYGFTAEKDAGEEFFTGSNKQGFDFYSAHLFLRDYNHLVKAVALGDFAASFGQGLLVHSGFGYGKGATVMNIKRSSRTLRPFTSVAETSFLRGAGITLQVAKNWETTTFASLRKRDANITEPDTTLGAFDTEISTFSSLLDAGLHRTPNEITDEGALQQLTLGGNLKYKRDYWHIAANVLYDQFDKTLERNPAPYNRFYFSGDRLLNASLDYSFIWRNFNFFGETAMSDNGAIATINGLLLGLHRRVDLAILHRYFPKDYQALNANPFAETSGAINEQGTYVGLEIRPLSGWTLSGFFDTYYHPWLRFGVDAPSRGYEWRTRLTYIIKRKLEAYVQVRQETKEKNAPENTTKIDFLLPNRILQARFHISHNVNKSIELRSRLDYSIVDDGVHPRSQGIMLYQDVVYKPIAFPFSFTTRFAIFDTDGYDNRFYAFENNLLYTFSIPAYYNRGTRFYFNLRYRGIRNLTLEARYAQTFWSNQDKIGSGPTEIAGQVQSSVSAQVKYSF